MLSAIAARKAAQAAKLQHLPQGNGHDAQSDTPRPSPPSSSSESEVDLSPPPRKRKGQETESPRKKRQKRKSRLTNAEIGRVRYFEAQQPIEGFDDEESEVPVDPAATSRPYSPSRRAPDIDIDDGEYLAPVSGVVDPSRGFSPSRPMPESSEDEDQPREGLVISGEPGNTSHQEISHTPLRLTFTPRLDSNTFRLTNAELASLQLQSDDADSNGATLVLLSPGTSLSFVGTASITLLRGAVAILGTPLTPSLHPHRIFSPRSSPLVSLETLPVLSDPQEAIVSLLQPNHPNGGILPQRIQSSVGASDSVVVIQHLHTGIEGIGSVCRTFDGVFDVDSDMRGGSEDDTIGIRGFHLISPHTRPHPQLQPFSLPESWSKAFDATVPSLSSTAETALSFHDKSFIALVRGPKKCGKSTFARTLLNRLTIRYQNVAFLECDLGQSEFTPGGMVSLHVISKPVFGPPFTHPKFPFRAHYVGHTTPRSSPSHYLSCIQALVQTYRMDVQYAYAETSTDAEFYENASRNIQELDGRIDTYVPLVVNTQGWIKGLGGDLLRKIEEIVQATDVFELDAQASILPRQRIHRPSTARVHMLQPILTSPLAAYYTAADHRSLAILSYFHHVFRDTGAGYWSTELPLCARPPWEINSKEAIDRIILVGAGYEDVVPHELDRAINCGVVALVCDEDFAVDPSENGSSTTLFSYTQGAPAPSPSTSYCRGLALIRGVDGETGMLHLLTPIPPSVLARCRILVKGELELPVWGMLDFRESPVDGVAGVPWDKVPYLQMGGRGPGAVGAGAGKKRVRRNLMRRGQM